LRFIYRTGQVCPATYVIRLLMGQSSDRARAQRHNQLAEFGIGGSLTVDEWRRIIRQMLALGLLVIKYPHRALEITDAGYAVLRGTTRVGLRQFQTIRKPASKRIGRIDNAPAVARGESVLLEQLLKWRSNAAKARHCLADEVMNIATLMQLSLQRPRTLGALNRIVGNAPDTVPDQRKQLLELLAGDCTLNSVR